MAEVLVLGGGGREQALQQALAASPEVDRVVVKADPQTGLDAFKGSAEKPLVVIGPEALAVSGLADELRQDGYPVLGPSKQAAQYEASKARTARMAAKAGIVQPDFVIAEGPYMDDRARAYINSRDPSIYVIKADGLARGKGVVLPKSEREAREVVEDMIAGKYMGAGKETIVFSERKKGSEVSVTALVGEGGKDDFLILPLAQDHKRLRDGDQGPNTGGMGAYASVPNTIVNAQQYQRIEQKVYDSLAGMEAEGVDYKNAVLCMGVMMSPEELEDESYLIEYNTRFGDPEIQAMLPILLQAGIDVYRLLHSTAEGSIEHPQLDLRNIGYSALSVCLAAPGYPGAPIPGAFIHGLDKEYENVSIQLASVTTDADGVVRTSGGRALYVTGVGPTIDQAANYTYAAIGPDAINFLGNQYRTDIGWQARSV